MNLANCLTFGSVINDSISQNGFPIMVLPPSPPPPYTAPAVRQPPHVAGVQKWWSPPYTATCRWCSAWLVAFTQRLLCKHAWTCNHAPASGYCFKNNTRFLSPNIDYLNTHGCDASCRSSTHINWKYFSVFLIEWTDLIMVLTLQKRLIHLSKAKAKHLTVKDYFMMQWQFFYVPNYVNIFF